MEVKDIIIYPIKSLGGISVLEANCEEAGLEYDRRMMLADEEGKFVSQRSFPELALVGAELVDGGFRFFDKNRPSNSITIMHDSSTSIKVNVTVWKHHFTARKVLEVSDWFSALLGAKVQLVRMDEDSARFKSLVKAPSRTRLSMADGYPYLVISENSLEDLNRRLIVPVPMNRFRPNIVMKGMDKAYGEEEMDRFSAGSVSFRMIKQCVRCNMITIDQKTAKKLVEPLKTLSLYKKEGNKVYFGMNAVCLGSG